MSVFHINGVIKNYEWGRLGKESSVAMLYKSSNSDFVIQPDAPYAELWMGTHPSGPAVIPSLNNMTLSNWIAEHPESLGCNIQKHFHSPGLPFLFKVLSVSKSLSIQVHPDKPTAEQLHREFGHLYPDDNHKPEMAIALTKFQALCGFRPITEIKTFIEELLPLQVAIGKETAARFLDDSSSLLETVFTNVLIAPDDQIRLLLQELDEYFKSNTLLSDFCKSVKATFLTTYSQYPGDVGCFCIFFLNLINLEPGQAMYLGANVPHAYLKGDCIECMACSDNVIRAGLTPKHKDIPTLCKVLSYQCKSANENLFLPVFENGDQCVQVYNPPIPEFAVSKIDIECSNSCYKLQALDSASILIVVEGEAEAYQPQDPKALQMQYGTIMFVGSKSILSIEVKSKKMIIYRAYCA